MCCSKCGTRDLSYIAGKNENWLRQFGNGLYHAHEFMNFPLSSYSAEIFAHILQKMHSKTFMVALFEIAPHCPLRLE